MAVYTFGLTATTALLPLLPYDASQIGAATTPIKNSDLTDALLAGSAKMITLGESKSITVATALATSDEESHDVFMRCALAHAVADILRRDGKYPALLAVADAHYQTLHNQIQAMPDAMLGDTYAGTGGIDVDMDDVGTATNDQEIGGWDFESDGNVF